MNGMDHHLVPEAKTAPMFAVLALIVCGLWVFTVGVWSVIPFALGFSLVKRQVTLTGMRNADMYASDIDQLRLELRHLNSKLWMITTLQYVVWLLFWLATKKG
jgi:hypothetical protein